MSLFAENQRIASPSQLIDFIRELKRAVASGELRQVEGGSPSTIQPLLLQDLPDTGPWPDLFELFFADTSGATFRLGVETYHGQGGTWTRLDS